MLPVRAMAASSTARVTYRSLELASAAAVSDRGGGLRFVALDAPPPVRTVLALGQDGAPQIAVEVVLAIEVEAPGVVRGAVVREVDSALLHQPVGSERLASGAAGGELPPSEDHGSASSSSEHGDDSFASTMAVPAPVVGDGEPSDAIDVDGEPDERDDGNEDGNGDSAADSGSGRAKKRRGRKRK